MLGRGKKIACINSWTLHEWLHACTCVHQFIQFLVFQEEGPGRSQMMKMAGCMTFLGQVFTLVHSCLQLLQRIGETREQIQRSIPTQVRESSLLIFVHAILLTLPQQPHLAAYHGGVLCHAQDLNMLDCGYQVSTGFMSLQALCRTLALLGYYTSPFSLKLIAQKPSNDGLTIILIFIALFYFLLSRRLLNRYILLTCIGLTRNFWCESKAPTTRHLVRGYYPLFH